MEKKESSMTPQRPRRRETRFDAGELRDLGFPDELIEPARYLAERGAYDVEPPHQLIEDTLNACIEELESSSISVPVPVLQPQVMWHALRDSAAELSRLGRVPATYADGLYYLYCNNRAPLVMVENHNLVTPVIWGARQFQDIRHACRVINRTARCFERPVSRRVVVLKPDLRAYTTDEIRQIALLARDASSDVYWISPETAGEFASKNAIVVGDMRVLSISEKPASASEAEEMLLNSTMNDPTQAIAIRTRIESLAECAVPVKTNGVLTREFQELLAGSDPAGPSKAIQQVLGMTG
jgi:hypothetical protein